MLFSGSCSPIEKEIYKILPGQKQWKNVIHNINTSILQLTSERDHLLLWSRRWMSRTHNSLKHGHGQLWLINASEGLTCRKEPKLVTYNRAKFYMPYIFLNILKRWFR